MFQDITTLLLDPKAFKDTVDLFVERYKHEHITLVAGSFFFTFSFVNCVKFCCELSLFIVIYLSIAEVTYGKVI